MGTIWGVGVIVCWAITLAYILTAWMKMAVWYAKGNSISENQERHYDYVAFPKSLNLYELYDDWQSMAFSSVVTAFLGCFWVVLWPLLIPVAVLKYLHDRNKVKSNEMW
jgi:hypothetical protein